ncbi:MAG: ATPase V [Pirellulaceae bacterium]
MSIVPLVRATFIGLSNDKERLLDDLHRFGCLEIIPLGKGGNTNAGGPSSQAREALKFLLSAPQRRHPVSDQSLFDAEKVERQSLELQSNIQSMEAERDDLLQRYAAARPFGEFHFAPPEQMGGQRLWFYVVPHKEMAKLSSARRPDGTKDDLVWECVARDARFCYVVVVSQHEPENMPVPRSKIGARSPLDLARRLEELELAIEDAQAERSYLTRWSLLFAKNLGELEDAAARVSAAGQTCDTNLVFALEAWAPQERAEELLAYAREKGYVLECRPPVALESPPTLMRNAPRVEAGEDLVNFYMTPGYWTWDPSAVVLVSFAIFFAMIMADAGYAALLTVTLLIFWRRLGRSESGRRFRPMLAMIVAASLVYGTLVGSYFGITPSENSLLSRLHLLDMNNSKMMMGLSVLVGGAHILMATLMDARRHALWRDGLGSIGWFVTVAGGLLVAFASATSTMPWLKVVGGSAVVAGLLLVVGYTAPQEKPLKRLVQGVLGLTKVSAVFGDILSYLRLFALGLASASLAIAFNDMAAGIRGSMPRFGLLLALLVLLFGHSLNLLLCISSGVIHGLRLNVIEFFNWGLKDEGRRFTPFRRKEGSLWN